MSNVTTPVPASDLAPLLQGRPHLLTIWQHYKGQQYIVTGRAILEATMTPLVLYQRHPAQVQALCTLDTANPQFARPVQEWEELVEWQGKKVRRFVPVFNDGQGNEYA